MTQITMSDHSPRARHPGVRSQVGLGKHFITQWGFLPASVYLAEYGFMPFDLGKNITLKMSSVFGFFYIVLCLLQQLFFFFSLSVFL